MRPNPTKNGFVRCLGLCIAMVGVSAVSLVPHLGAQSKENPAQPKDPHPLPDGVIHVALPPGVVTKVVVFRNGKPLLRVMVGQTWIEAKELFFGDFKGAMHFEALKEGVHLVPATGGKGSLFDPGMTSDVGATYAAKDFIPLRNLKPGSIYVTTPSLDFKWGADTKSPTKVAPLPGAQAKDGAALPDGVIHIGLPAGTVKKEPFSRNGKPLLRVTVDKTVIEAKALFFGDFKGAVHLDAFEGGGVFFVTAKGGKGVLAGTVESSPGSMYAFVEDFVPVNKLKPASILVTTPSIGFRWGADAKILKE